MCLGVPGRVVSLEPDGQWAVIETMGLEQKVGVQLVEGVAVGDYLIVHAGYAIEKLDLEDAVERLRLWEEILSRGEDAVGRPAVPAGRGEAAER